ncbi:FecR family protein [Xanthomarina sp. F1114]|uniref:FecR family protein n=1 Tax=Xanthomarina sp. F1114 TaxID=2996019 RepID=UPI00225DF245|nr:FecR family protein [Xanthomarina sp. F1114]MCX7547201.1 FecR family protein [Xanthomarina sp. F1114]
MIPQKTEKLIVKYLTNQATALELDQLEEWLKDPNNKQLFSTYVKLNYAVDYNTKQFDSSAVKRKLDQLTKRENKVIRLKKSQEFLKYAAAIVIGVFALGYMFKDDISFINKEAQSVEISDYSIETGSNKAILTLENGKEVALEKTKTYQTEQVTSNGEAIVYQPSKTSNKEIAYNYLTIPRGGQFFITLSDGTKVWLNSDSKLKYPISFQAKEPRVVELVYGEAFFEVSPSSMHQGASFIVNSNNQEIEVLGTAFNLKAYADETNTYTTLVEGKIALITEETKNILKPTQQAILNKNQPDNILIKTVDVYNEISWKDGVFSFKAKPLKELMIVLSRWYDVDVVFENKKLENTTFRGVLSKEQTIEDILLAIQNASIINSFTIKDKTITIK